MFLIDWLSQSIVTLYIYGMRWTYPARNPIYISKSIKISSCTRTLLGPVKPVRPTGQTGRAIPATAPRPVRPLGQIGQTGWSSLLPILVVNSTFSYKVGLISCLWIT